MIEWIKNNKISLIIGIVIVMAVGIFYFFPTEQNMVAQSDSDWMKTDEEPSDGPTEMEKIPDVDQTKEKMIVDVKGAIANPGVYEVKQGDRVMDVILMAGGLLHNADSQNINFALRVEDEMVLYFPLQGEVESLQTADVQSEGVNVISSSNDGKVNLNKANESELQTLPGIGPSKALAIIEYRETNGSFQKIEDLMEISGIGEKTFEKLKEHIYVK